MSINMVKRCMTMPEPRSMKALEEMVSLIKMGIRVMKNTQEALGGKTLAIQVGSLLVFLWGKRSQGK